MDRKQRRGAQKIASASSPDPIAQTYAEAIRCHQAGAQAAYERVLGLRPNDAEALCNLGLALQVQGRLEQAAACQRKALVLRPEALVRLADALEALGRLDGAEAAYRRALVVDSALSHALCNLGSLPLDRGKLEEAASALRKSPAIEPCKHWSLCNLMILLEPHQNFEEGASGRRTIALRPDFLFRNRAGQAWRHRRMHRSLQPCEQSAAIRSAPS
jgi:tetratricopeptide (TPR) repeat protein